MINHIMALNPSEVDIHWLAGKFEEPLINHIRMLNPPGVGECW